MMFLWVRAKVQIFQVIKTTLVFAGIRKFYLSDKKYKSNPKS